MSYTYASWQTALSTMLAIPTTDANFQAILPSVIDYAEGRIYRELDMLVEDIRDSSASTTTLDRNFNLPTSIGTFQIISSISVITPASTAPESGTRNVLTPVSQTILDWTWPSSTGAGLPTQFAYISQSAVSGQKNVILGPWPDAAYQVEVTGKIIPTALSASNTTTFLTTYLPDLWMAATMVYMSGYERNWGAQADDPKSGLSWEAQFGVLLKSAGDWEARKKFSGASWTSKPLEPLAQPQRG